MPIQISEHTRQILIRFMPQWMRILEEVNFNIQELNARLISKMEWSYPFCFIGEGHKNNKDYKTPNTINYCNTCHTLSHITPSIFGSIQPEYTILLTKSQNIRWVTKAYPDESIVSKIKKSIFDTTDQGKSNFLTFTAQHFLKNHEVIA